MLIMLRLKWLHGVMAISMQCLQMDNILSLNVHLLGCLSFRGTPIQTGAWVYPYSSDNRASVYLSSARRPFRSAALIWV